MVRVNDLTDVLAGFKPGDWVALDSSMRRVLFSAPDAGALVNLIRANGNPRDILMMWVPDPSTASVY